ncbi:hypothetical protein F4679DRAFT_584804 [Xylaria curta]|nr:hypothetical protein F4679DRAFT_584804 [Xylaria curta]
MNQEIGTVTFLHRTVRDFLKTREMSDFLANKIPPGFNLSLSLLKVYTAMIKRTLFEEKVVRQKFGMYGDCYLQSLTANALACVAEMEDSQPHNTVAYKVLEELDRVMPIKVLQEQAKFDSKLPPEAFVREQLIAGQHVGFLAWKLPQNPVYFSWCDGSFIFPILNAKNVFEDFDFEFNLGMPWRSRGVEILRLVLETQKPDLNKAQWNQDPIWMQTPWAVLIGHITSWSRGTAKVVEERFWSLLENNVLSMLLRQGVDSEAMVWRDNVEGWPAFATYLNLVFEMPFDAAREALYLQVLGDFLQAGATLDPSNTRLMNSSVQQELGAQVKIVSTIEKFSGRLETMNTVRLRARNSRLLAEVVDMLLSNIDDAKTSGMAQVRVALKTAVETAFSAEICERFRTRYPAILDSGSKAEKRRADTELEWDSVKTLKTSSSD